MNVITADRTARKATRENEKHVVNLELAEVQEISELMFKKLEMKIQVIRALEASVDKKKAELDQLVQRAEALEKKLGSNDEITAAVDMKSTALTGMARHDETLHAPGGMNRRHEIAALSRKGLAPREIAEVLVMPQGEVELILELDLLPA